MLFQLMQVLVSENVMIYHRCSSVKEITLPVTNGVFLSFTNLTDDAEFAILELLTTFACI